MGKLVLNPDPTTYEDLVPFPAVPYLSGSSYNPNPDPAYQTQGRGYVNDVTDSWENFVVDPDQTLCEGTVPFQALPSGSSTRSQTGTCIPETRKGVNNATDPWENSEHDNPTSTLINHSVNFASSDQNTSYGKKSILKV